MTTTAIHSEIADTPLALLAKGERQIAAGQYREGSATVYQAAFTARREVATRRGWVRETYEEADDIIYRLDGVEPPLESMVEEMKRIRERRNEPLPVYSLLFTTVTCFKIHGATVFRDGKSLPVTFGEPEHVARHHHAPNQRWSFLQATQRIANPVLPVSALKQRLDNNQRTLHTHFYHGNLTAVEFLRSRNVGLNFVDRIIAVAEQFLP